VVSYHLEKGSVEVLKWIRTKLESRLWKRIRSLECEGQHPHSILSDAACDECRPLYELLYPQGWSTYQGDVCEHGAYVGGVGADYMCGPCEMGYQQDPSSRWQLKWIRQAVLA